MGEEKYYYKKAKEKLECKALELALNTILNSLFLVASVFLVVWKFTKGNIGGLIYLIFVAFVVGIITIEVKDFIRDCKYEIDSLRYRSYIEDETEKIIAELEARLKDRGNKTLDEILKEQENGDTKEVKCELEQGS